MSDSIRTVVDHKALYWLLALAVAVVGIILSIVLFVLPLLQGGSTNINNTVNTVQPPPNVFDADFWKQDGVYYVDKAGNRFIGEITLIRTDQGGFDRTAWGELPNPATICCDTIFPAAIARLVYYRPQGFCNNQCDATRGFACFLNLQFANWFVSSNNGMNNNYPGSNKFNPTIDYSGYLKSLIGNYDLFLIYPPIRSCTGSYIYRVVNQSLSYE